MHYTLRFWAENISPPRIVDAGLDLLREYSAGVGVALFPESMTDENASAFRQLKEAGVQLGFWPLLPREEGYFPGERNVDRFSSFARRLVRWAEDESAKPDLVAVDQELPFEQMLKVLNASFVKKGALALETCLENLDRTSFEYARGRLSQLNQWLKQKGVDTLTACLPWIGLEFDGRLEVIQDMMETPVMGIDWDIISPMSYASMISGMSGGLVTLRDADWLTFDICLGLRAARGRNSGISLGLTGTGVFESEPVFSEPAQLVTGVEAALAAGVRDVSIYNLEGTLARAEPRRWFEALRNARPRVPPRSNRVVTAVNAARSFHRVVGPLVYRFS